MASKNVPNNPALWSRVKSELRVNLRFIRARMRMDGQQKSTRNVVVLGELKQPLRRKSNAS